MTTMSQAIRAYVESAAGKVTSDQIKSYINSHYPGQWQQATIQAHLYGCAVNNSKAYIHHASAEKFLYHNADGTFELYSEVLHGPNEWAPTIADDEDVGVEELAETSISLERDVEDHLIGHLDDIESGLKFIARQEVIDVGRVDILAKDTQGNRVVIEVKVGDAKDSAIGQIARYLGWYAKKDGKPSRGFLIAGSFPEGVQYAAATIPDLTLVVYQVHFSFDHVHL